MLTGLHEDVPLAPANLPGDLGCPGPLAVGSAHGCLLCRRWVADWGGSELVARRATRPQDQPEPPGR